MGFIYICAYTYGHMTMNPPSPFHNLIVNRLHDAQDSSYLFYVYFSSSYTNCDGVFGSSSSSNGVPFCFLPMHIGLHHILKYAPHTRHHIYRSHFLAIYYMKVLPMDIGSLCSSPTCILLSIINGSYSFGLLVPLAMNGPQ